MLHLDRSLSTLRGIGPKRASELAGLGYETFEDLLYHLPFRYEDRRLRLPLSRLAEGDRISFLATVRAPRMIWTRRRGFNIFQAKLDDGTAVFPVVWYNQPYLARALTEGREAWFFGELRRARTGDRALRFENPQYETVDPEPESVPRHTARIVPIYERLGSLSGKSVRALVHAIWEDADADTDAGASADSGASGDEDAAAVAGADAARRDAGGESVAEAPGADAATRAAGGESAADSGADAARRDAGGESVAEAAGADADPRGAGGGSVADRGADAARRGAGGESVAEAAGADADPRGAGGGSAADRGADAARRGAGGESVAEAAGADADPRGADGESRGRAHDPLPAAMRERLGLVARDEALRRVHFPETGASLEELNAFTTPHYRRLVFDEFFGLNLGLALRRAGARRVTRGFAYVADAKVRARLAPILPFTLTGGQTRVLDEIVADLVSPHPMNRLLQGEVGSGKTILAALVMALAAENGLQAALMAPTEVLAAQHARSLSERLAAVGLAPVLLTSAVKGEERRARLAALASGEAKIAVGTHALIEEGVAFARLGLVIVDEQHRFGVMQRARLGGKAGPETPAATPAPTRDVLPAVARTATAAAAAATTTGAGPGPMGAGSSRSPAWSRSSSTGSAAPPRVDTLVMTATPIPRTLALAAYGDLDLSVLDELPPGRSPVTTRVIGEADRPRLDATMRAAVAAGRQVFVVTPLAVGSERLDLKAAQETAQRLAAGALAGTTVGLLHGRMKPAEKSAVMEAFREGRLAVLVATTVVEVGIDVPNASLLVVEHAERFGLSQLHQLRGRIGRGAHPGTCLLVAGEDIGETARARLAAIERETSGFRIAEADLALRGPGEVLGTRQSGIPDLRAGDLVRDRDVFDIARREAFALVDTEGENGPVVRRLIEGMRAAWRRRWRLSEVG